MKTNGKQKDLLSTLRQLVPAESRSSPVVEAALHTLGTGLEMILEDRAQEDTQWDRDARAFTARCMVRVRPAEAVRLGAEAADALAVLRKQRAEREG